MSDGLDSTRSASGGADDDRTMLAHEALIDAASCSQAGPLARQYRNEALPGDVLGITSTDSGTRMPSPPLEIASQRNRPAPDDTSHAANGKRFRRSAPGGTGSLQRTKNACLAPLSRKMVSPYVTEADTAVRGDRGDGRHDGFASCAGAGGC